MNVRALPARHTATRECWASPSGAGGSPVFWRSVEDVVDDDDELVEDLAAVSRFTGEIGVETWLRNDTR